MLSVILIFVKHMYVSSQDNVFYSLWDQRACFLKTPVSLQFSDLHFNILLSEKCNSSTVHLYERERARERKKEREREREMLCMYELPS